MLSLRQHGLRSKLTGPLRRRLKGPVGPQGEAPNKRSLLQA